MPEFPDDLVVFRAIENRDGVVYDADKTKILYAEDMNGCFDEIEAIEGFLGTKGRRIFSNRVELSALASDDKIGIQDESATKELKYMTISNFADLLISFLPLYEVSNEGLVLAMNFNSESISGSAGSETVYDSSDSNNHGVNTGADHDVDGGFNGGGCFDFVAANSDHITVLHNTSLSPDFLSVSCWFKTSSATQQNLINKYHGDYKEFQFAISAVGNVSLTVGKGSTPNIAASSNVGNLADGEWHYAVGTCDGSYIRIYVDGVIANNPVACSPISHNTYAIEIGKASWYSGLYFDGMLDSVRIYNRILSADEINLLYLSKAEVNNPYVSKKNILVDSAGKSSFQSDVFNVKTSKTPATAGATGVVGDICWDSGFIYVCVATNTWKKIAISTW